ncbi:MAG TPA: pyridoxamine 5'-phosphate oxidase family protein [Acidimicrobiales bacterium]|nr:pyridoxamine 5'-phosphate oxidase family protein [Acidimicrobiales bacterium]
MTDPTHGDSGRGVRPRRLQAVEVDEVLEADVPAHLAMVDAAGCPAIIPIWFLWDGSAFLMTSRRQRPHVALIMANAAVAVCVDLEAAEQDDGQRPNRQVRGSGFAEVIPDDGGEVTRRITQKYLRGPGAARRAAVRAAQDRVVIRLAPERLVAVASA